METSKRLRNLCIKRENKINEYFNLVVKWLFNKYENTRTIIIGYNKSWKKEVNMGKENNRNFYSIPYRKLIDKIHIKARDNDVKIKTTNESYTSKCDSLALEHVGHNESYSGKRTKRGLFESATGKLINADVNGAINIMRKYLSKKGKELKKVKGFQICNPINALIFREVVSNQRITAPWVSN